MAEGGHGRKKKSEFLLSMFNVQRQRKEIYLGGGGGGGEQIIRTLHT